MANIHHRHTPISPKLDEGRMDESPPTCVLKTKVGYQKKRKTMLYQMVSAAAVKLYHGDQRAPKYRVYLGTF
jgi:hypothetical protein